MLQWAVATAGGLTEHSGDFVTLRAFMWSGSEPACLFVVLTKGFVGFSESVQENYRLVHFLF
jgi:hypothetical protein